MSLEDTQVKEIFAIESKLQVDCRVVYRASAGCVDRLGTVMGVYETLIKGKYGFTYSVKLDPITVNKNSIRIRSDAMYHGENIEPGSRVIFTEQEVWNDCLHSVISKHSNAIVMQDVNRDGCKQCIGYKIQLDNVRAQNEMIRNIEPSDIINSSKTSARHISRKSLVFWEEDAEQMFADLYKYNDSHTQTLPYKACGPQPP